MSDDFWERAARQDPLFAILSDPTKSGRRWDINEFFETGRREVSLLMYQLRQLGHFPRPQRALDFGCGVGRLTQALSATFGQAVGVDVSPTMIDLATRLNRRPEQVRYVLNQSATLSQFRSGEFDFIYSDIVLQHLEPEAARTYVTEFLRLLAPGGVVVFQLPSHRRSPAEYAKRPVHMAKEAYAARIRVVEPPPALMRPDDTVAAIVEVHNDSPLRWDQHETGVMRLGNHWRARAGEMVIQDDGRSSLPSALDAGRTVGLQLTVKAPPDPGEFICEFDVVHEGISWFGDMGSPTARTSVLVASTVADAAGAPARDIASASNDVEFPDIYSSLPSSETGDLGAFPMHGVPRDDVIRLVEAHGGAPFFIEDDERGGPEWQGYRYFVEKSPQRAKQ